MEELTPKQAHKIIKTAKKQVKNEFNQALKNGTEKFYPAQLSLTKWCAAYGNLERLEWITDLIFSELEQDKELEEHIYIDLDPRDILLDSDGVLILWDTLSGFFGADQVKGMFKYLKATNEEAKLFYDIKVAIKKATESELEKYSQVWEEAKQNKENSQDVINRVLNIIQQEQHLRTKKKH